jgi:hypothetical protein
MVRKIFQKMPADFGYSLKRDTNIQWSITFRLLAKLILLLVLFSIISPGFLAAQTGEETSASTGLKGFYLTASPTFQLGSPVNGGGTLSVNSLYAGGGFLKQLNEKFGLGLGLLYSLDDFRFSGVNAIPLAKPWGTVVRYGAAIPLVYTISDQWRLVAIPIGLFAGETGAKWGSSLVYGGVASINYTWGQANFIGVGVGVFQNIAETDAFPYLNVNWQITDRWRLSNPPQSSPTGPGGLQLSYGLTPHWEIGLAGAYRFNRFRLDKNGSLPNGIGQYSQMPLVGNITYTYSLVSLTAYGGIAFNNKLWMEDSGGHGIYRADQKPAPLVGANLTIGMEPTQFRAQPWQINAFRTFF